MAREVVNTVETAAVAFEKLYREKTKVMDEGAVKLRVIVRCVDKQDRCYALPVRVVVNGVEHCEIFPDVNEAPLSHLEQETIVWHSAKIKQAGIEKIQIQVIPADGAERYFGTGKSHGRAYTPAYTRNQEEKTGREYYCPPKQEKGESQTYDDQEGHRVVVYVPIKRRLRFGREVDVPREYWINGRRQAEARPTEEASA